MKRNKINSDQIPSRFSCRFRFRSSHRITSQEQLKDVRSWWTVPRIHSNLPYNPIFCVGKLCERRIWVNFIFITAVYIYHLIHPSLNLIDGTFHRFAIRLDNHCAYNVYFYVHTYVHTMNELSKLTSVTIRQGVGSRGDIQTTASCDATRNSGSRSRRSWWYQIFQRTSLKKWNNGCVDTCLRRKMLKIIYVTHCTTG